MNRRLDHDCASNDAGTIQNLRTLCTALRTRHMSSGSGLLTWEHDARKTAADASRRRTPPSTSLSLGMDVACQNNKLMSSTTQDLHPQQCGLDLAGASKTSSSRNGLICLSKKRFPLMGVQRQFNKAQVS
jgi:hypothetical protein